MNNKSTTNTPEDFDISNLTTASAGVLEATVHRNLQKYCESVLKHYDLTKMHWMLIGTVLTQGNKGIRLTDLAKELGTTISYITTSVNLLTSRGIITRAINESDSRSTFIAISDSYRKTCDEIELKLREALRKAVYAHVHPDDLKVYLRVMNSLAKIDPSKTN